MASHSTTRRRLSQSSADVARYACRSRGPTRWNRTGSRPRSSSSRGTSSVRRSRRARRTARRSPPSVAPAETSSRSTGRSRTRRSRRSSGEHPDRFFEMYIAEQQMVATAVGLQIVGWHPFASTFAAFLSRAYDFVRMAAVSRARIALSGSHAGVSIGEDGPSQMGLEDIAMFRAIHGSVVLHPCDANQTAKLVPAMADVAGIAYIRTLARRRPSSTGRTRSSRSGEAARYVLPTRTRSLSSQPGSPFPRR